VEVDRDALRREFQKRTPVNDDDVVASAVSVSEGAAKRKNPQPYWIKQIHPVLRPEARQKTTAVSVSLTNVALDSLLIRQKTVEHITVLMWSLQWSVHGKNVNWDEEDSSSA
jgi:hypothetical protein